VGDPEGSQSNPPVERGTIRELGVILPRRRGRITGSAFVGHSLTAKERHGI